PTLRRTSAVPASNVPLSASHWIALSLPPVSRSVKASSSTGGVDVLKSSYALLTLIHKPMGSLAEPANTNRSSKSLPVYGHPSLSVHRPSFQLAIGARSGRACPCNRIFTSVVETTLAI